MQSLPERFKHRPRTQALEDYISRKYSKYGYSKGKHIEYNREFIADGTRDKYRWVENVSDGLRYVGASHDIIRLGHTGWYNDNFQDETIHGEVYQLPARNGVPQFVPGVSDPCNDNCACIDFSSVTDDKEDAARWADSAAEQWAERERDYQAEEDRKQRLSDIEDEIKTLYADFRRISREIRANCDRVQGIAVIRELVRNEWVRTKAEIHKLRAERERIEKYGIEY
jgi:hypothetical protein